MSSARWVAVVLVGTVIAALVGMAWWPRPVAPAPGAPPPFPPAPVVRTVGVAGCAGAACHGGPVKENVAAGLFAATPWLDRTDTSSSASAATIWLEHDRHSQAFAALSSPAARAIMAHLDRDDSDRLATQDGRCLACHTNPRTVWKPDAQALDDSAAAWTARRDGVSCEACHGDAGPWLASHTTWGRRPQDRPAMYKRDGMTWLNQPFPRADVCAGCHVGAPADETARLPRREVTHEMLAAGHPRLVFELTSYLKSLPRHWVERDRTLPEKEGTRGRDFAAQCWLAGQTAGTQAALRLLLTTPEPSWPEFARYDCYACHHDLHPESWRRAPDGGRLIGNRWELSLPLRTLAGQERELHDALAVLQREMSTLDRKAILRSTAAAEGKINRWRSTLSTAAAPDRLLAAALRDAMADEQVLQRLHWDETAQLGLALAAWGDTTGRPPRFQETHEALMVGLRFPAGPHQAWNSPRGYDPGKAVKSLKTLHQLLDEALREAPAGK